MCLTSSLLTRLLTAALLCVGVPAAYAATLENLAPPEAAIAAGQTAEEVDLSSREQPPARFIARKEPVENLLKAIGSELRKVVRMSSKARQYRVSGEFNLQDPFEVIERVTASLGLIWYFDGQVIYVYDNSEAASSMLTISSKRVDSLVAFLKKSALYDHRYPIRHTPGADMIYVSGPPKYVEIVQGATAMMQTQADSVERHERHVEMVKIKHATVGTRTFSKRGERESVAGLADVLAVALGSGATVSNNVAPSSVPVANAAGATEAPLPAGVREMPPLDVSAVAAAAMGAPTQPGSTTRPVQTKASIDGASPMNIVAYPATNSLLLEGTAQQLATARRLIDQLDLPRDQVEISLWVIDVERKNLDALGAKWGAAANFGRVGMEFNLSALGKGATLSRADTVRFLASVTALSSQNKARIVSRPILLAQDNSPAVFDNSKTFFVRIRGERVASLERITYGTMIDVTPHVVDTRGRIELELNIEDGNQSNPGEDSGLDLPEVTSTKISTQARVQHEQSILIGGYTQSYNTEGAEKIPLLGDIPFIGRLFTYNKTDDMQSVRLFLIQPRVLDQDSRFEHERLRTPREVNDAVDALRTQVEARRG